MSHIDMDGSHTIAKKGGEEVGYQVRKKSKTSNLLFLSDNQGIVLAFSEVQSGNHHDLYDINRQLGYV